MGARLKRGLLTTETDVFVFDDRVIPAIVEDGPILGMRVPTQALTLGHSDAGDMPDVLLGTALADADAMMF